MKTCPKCRYARKLTDKDKPDWQCPSCGIAYAKFDDRPASVAAPRSVAVAEGQNAMSGKAMFWIAAFLLSAAYVAYDTQVAKPAAVADKIRELFELVRSAGRGDVEFDDTSDTDDLDDIDRAFRWAGQLPIGQADRYAILAAPSPLERIEALAEAVESVTAAIRFQLMD